MTVAVIDDSTISFNLIEKASAMLDDIRAIECMTLIESFDKLSVLSIAEPQVKPDIILISFAQFESAFEVVLAIKSDEKYALTPIISFGNADEEHVVRSIQESGCIDYVNDINNITEIYARLRVAVNLHHESVKYNSLEQEIEEYVNKLAKITNTDALTGLLSRAYFEQKVEEEINRAMRGKYYVSLIKLDIINFKDFNKKFGFLEGDKTLRRISNVLKRSVSNPGDLLARIGGDSFALFLPSIDLQTADSIGKEVYRNVRFVALPFDSENENLINVQICGISLIPVAGDNARELIKLVGDITSSCESGVSDGDNYFCVKN